MAAALGARAWLCVCYSARNRTLPVSSLCGCKGGEGGGAMSTSWSGGAAACERFGSGGLGAGGLVGRRDGGGLGRGSGRRALHR